MPLKENRPETPPFLAGPSAPEWLDAVIKAVVIILFGAVGLLLLAGFVLLPSYEVVTTLVIEARRSYRSATAGSFAARILISAVSGTLIGIVLGSLRRLKLVKHRFASSVVSQMLSPGNLLAGSRSLVVLLIAGKAVAGFAVGAALGALGTAQLFDLASAPSGPLPLAIALQSIGGPPGGPADDVFSPIWKVILLLLALVLACMLIGSLSGYGWHVMLVKAAEGAFRGALGNALKSRAAFLIEYYVPTRPAPRFEDDDVRGWLERYLVGAGLSETEGQTQRSQIKKVISNLRPKTVGSLFQWWEASPDDYRRERAFAAAFVRYLSTIRVSPPREPPRWPEGQDRTKWTALHLREAVVNGALVGAVVDLVHVLITFCLRS